MRVLHLIDAASPQATPTTLALLSASLGRIGEVDQQVLLLGPDSLRRRARQAQIHDAQLLIVPGGRAYASPSALSGAIGRRGRFDLIHCWSVGAYTAAVLVAPNLPRVLTLTLTPERRVTKWLRGLTNLGAAHSALLPISNTIRGELIGGGVDPSQVHVLRPGLDLSWVAHQRRAELRRGWGVTSDTSTVVALLGDPPHRSDALSATMSVSLAIDSWSDQPCSMHLMLHPDQWRLHRALYMQRQIGRAGMHLVEARIDCPWQVLPGCDLALAIGPYAGGLSLLWAMASNVPVVAEATYAVCEVVEDRHSALLAKARPPELAARLRRIREPHLAWQLRDTARHEAYSFFSRQRYCQSLRTIYEQIRAGGQVQVEPLPVTGGLRFAGRA